VGPALFKEKHEAMSSLILRLLEQRANTWEGLKALLDTAEGQNRDLSAEEITEYDKRNADLDRLDARVRDLRESEQRAAEAEQALAELRSRPVEPGREPEPPHGREIRSFLQGRSGAVFEVRADRPMGTEEFRALSKVTAGSGGNTVRVGFYDRLLAHLIEVSGILRAGPTILNTSTGERIPVPKTTAHSTAVRTAEAAQIPSSDPVFGQVPLDAYKYALLLQVSTELVNDTSVDMEGYIAKQAGQAVGNAFGAEAIGGTGVDQPNGLVTAAALGVKGASGVGGTFTCDNLIDLFFSVISPYRNSSSCGWLLKDSSLAVARKLKDSTGQYLWQPSLQVGVPDTILAKPVHSDPYVPAVGPGTRSVLFGDISQYFVRQVSTIQFRQSEHFAFDSDMQTYRVTYRADGDLVDLTGAVKYFQGADS
jgi:HK97 family phage major capsid protein